MKIYVDKRFVKVGGVVTVRWDAEGATGPRIIMHMGRHETALAVPEKGEKKFRLKDSRGSHWIGLQSWVNGKEETLRHRVFVYGKPNVNGDKFEYLNGKPSWWNQIKERCKRWWSFFPSEKKRLYILLLLLIAYQVLFSFMLFTACRLLLTGIIFWLFWQVIKR